MCGIEAMFYQVKVLVRQRPSVLPLVGEWRYSKGPPSLQNDCPPVWSRIIARLLQLRPEDYS